MHKDFDRWNIEKQRLHQTPRRPSYYHPREIWWCAIGTNIGSEADGTGLQNDRPVVIIQGFNSETFFGAALIGHPRTGRYYFPLGRINDREAVVNLSQARLYDTKRLIRKIGTLDETAFRELTRALALTLFPHLTLK